MSVRRRISFMWQQIEPKLALSAYAVPICALAAALFVGCLYLKADWSGTGEPFAWFEGNSAWPSVGILFFTFLLCLHFIVKCNYQLKQDAQQLSRQFSLSGRIRRATPWFGWEAIPRKTSTGKGQRVDVWRLWRRYISQGRFFVRILRTAPMTLLYVLVLVIITTLVGYPYGPPLRGSVPLLSVLFWAVIAFLFLTFFVVDATMLHEKVIQQLASGETYWPDATFSRFGYVGKRNGGKFETELAYFWDIMLISKRTVAVGNLIYYPFIILFLLIVARFPSFDNWTWKPATVIALGMDFLLVLYTAWRLPKAASSYRDTVLAELKRNKRQALILKSEGVPEVIDTMIDEVQFLHTGAFSYLWEQPAIRALLLPSSGVGLVTLLQYVAR
jgi:hypothetical protein